VIFQSADRFTVSTYFPGAETAFSGVLAEFRVVGGRSRRFSWWSSASPSLPGYLSERSKSHRRLPFTPAG
jgi:hypothetical protein